MRQRTTALRLELLKKTGEGYTQAETIKHLVDKFNVTRSGAYYHFRTKKQWMKDYVDLANVQELQSQIIQRYNHIYREASFQYQHCMDHNGRVGYLRTMLEAAKCMRAFLPDGVCDTDVVTKIELSWNLDKLRKLKELEGIVSKP